MFTHFHSQHKQKVQLKRSVYFHNRSCGVQLIFLELLNCKYELKALPSAQNVHLIHEIHKYDELFLT